jgi:hypothetical protein
MPTEIVVADVSVTHRCAKSYVHRAAATPGTPAAARDDEKRRKYARAGTSSYRLVPLTRETYGRMGRPAYEFLVSMADQAASDGTVSKGAFIVNALQELSVSLCSGIARQVRAAGPLRRRLAGRAMLPGLARPTADLSAVAA